MFLYQLSIRHKNARTFIYHKYDNSLTNTRDLLQKVKDYQLTGLYDKFKLNQVMCKKIVCYSKLKQEL